MESLKGLDLINTVPTPISTETAAYYSDTLAQGSGPNGTYLITDFIGSATGITANPAISSATSFISDNTSTLSTLDGLYADMRAVLSGDYGTPPDIEIPSGPAAGSYSTYNSALVAIINACEDEIGNIIAATPANTVSSLNSSWYAMARQWSREPTNQALASIDISTLGSGLTPVHAFIQGLNGYGVDTQVGMSAQVLESVSNVSNQYGQALVGALREGRNNQEMDSNSIGHDNLVPDQPATPPPQATLSDSQYTVAQARALREDSGD